MTTQKILNDIVHGIIELPDYIVEIIDTVQFQKLRSISQLGFCSLVYPSASYSRFEHSIGTFHLASRLIRILQKQLLDENQTEIKIDDETIKCVEIAALCHDLGHGPYSHLWEDIVPMKHEELSVKILSDILNSRKEKHNKILKDEIPITDDMIKLIGKIILGECDQINKKFLFQIVANKESGIDVDKFDYLCRDSIYLGWSNKNKIHDIERILNFYRVGKNSKGEWCLAMRDREIFHIHEIFYLRHTLHRYGYKHKTVIALNCMFKDAMKIIVEKYTEELVKSVMINGSDPKSISLSSKEFISKCCDFHVWNAMMTCSDTQVIVKNIQERNLYKLFCKLQLKLRPMKSSTNEVRKQYVKDIEDIFNAKLGDNSIHVSLSTFSLQSENSGDPMLLIPFYRKDNPSECFTYQDDGNDLPKLVELIKDDFVLMIFTKTVVEDHSETKTKLEDIINDICLDKENKFPIYEFKKITY